LGEAWILAQEPQRFTLQLVAAQNEETISGFLEQHKLTGRAARYRFFRDGVWWYGVAYGSFAGRPEAKRAVSTLPKSLKATSPWVRPFADVQELIRSARARDR
jgi:DamX protein